MHLNTICTSHLCQHGAGRKILDQLIDFLCSQCTMLNGRIPAIRGSARCNKGIIQNHGRYGRASQSGGQLDKQLGIVGMNIITHFL